MSPVALPSPDRFEADYFDLPAALSALEDGRPLVFPPFRLTRTRIDGRDYTFCSNYDRDPIQKAQRKGGFYEADDLAEVAKHLPVAPNVLAVGANVGNHAIYFAARLAATVTVIEPNPVALAPLVANIVLNDLTHRIRMDALGIGLGAAPEAGLTLRPPARNLGGTRMERAKGGALEVHPGDALFAEDTFDLIKIDVEGMEIEVLSGLQQTIRRCRPLLFIEVDETNRTAFNRWMAAERYAVIFETRHYGANVNFLVQPIGEKT